MTCLEAGLREEQAFRALAKAVAHRERIDAKLAIFDEHWAGYEEALSERQHRPRTPRSAVFEQLSIWVPVVWPHPELCYHRFGTQATLRPENPNVWRTFARASKPRIIATRRLTALTAHARLRQRRASGAFHLDLD